MSDERKKLAVSDLDRIADLLNVEHVEVQQAVQRTLEHARGCGELLCQVRDDLMHGAWTSRCRSGAFSAFARRKGTFVFTNAGTTSGSGSAQTRNRLRLSASRERCGCSWIGG